MRDAREKQARQEQEQQEQNGSKKPQGAKDKPRNPDDRTEGERGLEDGAASDEPENDAKPWTANLPPELRDRLSGQEWEKLPPRYKKLVENYLKRLLEESAPTGR